MRIVIVGASGFVGGAIVSAAEGAGHDVVRVNAPRLLSSARGGSAVAEARGHVDEHVIGSLVRTFEGADAVVNAAGLARPDSPMNDALVGANSLLPPVIVRAAAATHVGRVVHVSSAAVYGDAEVLTETATPQPGSSYGRSKLWGEQAASSVAKESDLALVIYRPTSVHGAGRKMTESVRRLARSPLSSVAGSGDAPTPQTSVESVGALAVELAVSGDLPTSPVLHPWEGWTTASFLAHMGDGRQPVRIPEFVARPVLRTAKLLGRASDRLHANARRLELLWFGQAQSTGAAEERTRRIIIATTVDTSLVLLAGLPERLVSNGWEVHLVSSGGAKLARYARTPGVHVHTIPMAREPQPLRDVAALLRWLRLVRTVRPDVLYVGTPKASLLGSLSGWACRVPARVYLLRGLRAETAKGIKQKLLLSLEKFTIRCSTATLAVSESLAARVHELTGVRPTVLGHGTSNGIDLDRYRRTLQPDERAARRRALGLADDSLVLGFVGRINSDKGVDDALAALTQLRAAGRPVQLLLVGARESPLPFEDELEALSGIAVETGDVDRPEEFLELMDIFVMPSRREGFCNAILEAAAMEVPIVGARSTGIVDFVNHGCTGLLVDAGRPEQIVEAVVSIATQPDLASRLTSEAKKHVVAYDRSTVQDRYINYLEQAMVRTTK